MLDYGSLFSGIEAPAAAWHPLGWRTRWVSEVAKVPAAILAERLPGIPNLGDVRRADLAERALEAGRVDVVIGGSPCQAFSVAGLGGSLSDPRGLLTLRYVELIDEIAPALAVWENVSGVLDTPDNAFGHLLAGLCGETGGPLQPPGSRWPDCGVAYGPVRSVAWRRLEARHFGQASARDRILAVASARLDVDALDVLAEFEDEAGAPAPHVAKRVRKEIAAGGGGASYGKPRRVWPPMRRLPLEPAVGTVWGIGDGEIVVEDGFPTLTARDKGGGRMDYVAYRTAEGPVFRKVAIVEMEQMMGFPRGWTDATIGSTRTYDTSRATALGNSMSVSMIRWLGQRIEAALLRAWSESDDAADQQRLADYRADWAAAVARRNWEEEDARVDHARYDPEAFEQFRSRFGRPAA